MSGESVGGRVDGMTCLVFILLKAFHVWETAYDYPIALILLALDHLALIGWLRYRELRRR